MNPSFCLLFGYSRSLITKTNKSYFPIKNLNNVKPLKVNVNYLHTSAIAQKRDISLIAFDTNTFATPEDGFFRKITKYLKFTWKLEPLLCEYGCLIYTNIDELMDAEKFIKFFEIDDTFASWYRIKLLHLWIIAVRLMADEERGKTIRNAMLQAFYKDVDERAKKLGVMSASIKRKQINLLHEQFLATLSSYDAALDGDDKILASSLWRMFFNKEYEDAEKIECLVHYIRNNLYAFDRIASQDILVTGNFKFQDLISLSELRKL